MLDNVIMHYLSSKVSMLLGLVLALPSGIYALIQSEILPVMMAVAGGVLAFLWGVRKFPIEDQLKNARQVIQENFFLKQRNTALAEENERLKVQLAHIQEDSKQIRVDKRTDT